MDSFFDDIDFNAMTSNTDTVEAVTPNPIVTSSSALIEVDTFEEYNHTENTKVDILDEINETLQTVQNNTNIETENDTINDIVEEEYIEEPITESKKIAVSVQKKDLKSHSSRKTTKKENETYIGPNCMIQDIENNGNLIIAGTINGFIKNDGDITILETANIHGEISSTKDITIKSRVNHNINANGMIEIEPDCIVIGDIECKEIIIRGAVKGNIKATERVNLKKTAIIKGNIQTNALQMEPGAILEGSCSLSKEQVDFEKIFTV